MQISAIKLVRQHRLHGDVQEAVVLAEIAGKWIEVIREPIDSSFSTVVGPSEINELAAFELSTEDLVAAGGIADSP